ncbi:hypothetical protein A2973_05745 [Candidatus Gottesmanbacteria bacterium RIFCSPLOWO2_01_FULL_49_10]|uniref:Uncharacterized protein n=1 Tax=Candidatus Gottesmanbacteria bacterium RIFCSPLOWO2_01_FULL_49_10 TaxID=1798396 RepID=A0A1F6B1E9_9BACT|nr:MAG: hypothetical protein A2973_05745 [Candidatus Gottesmanbacteria bacterium RIFCSPLOWO2_01_FULL_49_10]
MAEGQELSLGEKKKDGIADRIRLRIDRMLHPVSTETAEQFSRIMKVLPEGGLRQSMERFQPRLRELLNVQDRQTFFGTLVQRVIFTGAGIGFMAVGALAPPFTLLHGAMGAFFTGYGLFGPSASEVARAAIRIKGAKQEAFFATPSGRDAARAFDQPEHANRVDQIVQMIALGSLPDAGTGGLVSPNVHPSSTLL